MLPISQLYLPSERQYFSCTKPIIITPVFKQNFKNQISLIRIRDSAQDYKPLKYHFMARR